MSFIGVDDHLSARVDDEAQPAAQAGSAADDDPAAAAGHPPAAAAGARAAGAHPRGSSKATSCSSRGRDYEADRHVRAALEPQPMPDETARGRARRRREVASNPKSRSSDDWSERSAGVRDAWSRRRRARRRSSPTIAHADAAGSPARGSSNTRDLAPRDARDRARDRRCDQRRRLPHRVARRHRRDAVARGRRRRRGSRARARASCRRSIPPGVGARSVGECIELQLRSSTRRRPGLRLGAAPSPTDISTCSPTAARAAAARAAASATKSSRRRSRWCAAAIRAPAPRSRRCARPNTSCPTCSCAAPTAGWTSSSIRSTLPRVRVNQSYAGMLGRGAGPRRAARAAAGSALAAPQPRDPQRDAAESRAQIVERQTAFLEHGEESMRPMILKDVAEAIDMHESTISRVTTEQIHAHAARRVRAPLLLLQPGRGRRRTDRRFVHGDPRQDPQADRRRGRRTSRCRTAASPSCCRGEGMPVARRTVAKYREALGIAPSSERKAGAALSRIADQDTRKETNHAIERLPAIMSRSRPSLRDYVEKKLERISAPFRPRHRRALRPDGREAPTQGRSHVAVQRQRDPRRRHRGSDMYAAIDRSPTSSTAGAQAQGKAGRPPRRRRRPQGRPA